MARKAAIFNIERHSLHDGPGIRTLIFFQGCPLRCLWCSNPEGQAPKPQLIFNERDCTACGRCLLVCPGGAIALAVDSSTQGADRPTQAAEAQPNRVRNNRAVCTGCATCLEVCRQGARQISGKLLSVEEVLAVIVRDEAFYRHSGGGVTLSGGEPLAQVDFAEELLSQCKTKGMHTAIETCGHLPWSTLKRVIPVTDLFLYDVKHLHPGTHLKQTGASNERILQNLAALSVEPVEIIVRVPVVPGFNDSLQELRRIVDLVRSLRTIREIHLLPYHALGSAKFAKLERLYELRDAQTPSPHVIQEWVSEIAVPDVQIRIEA